MTSSVADALVGRLIDGRYRILSHLADGGMASVYVALDGRLDREVALKVMRSGLASDAVFVERFRSEARSAARLSHPNVVAVYDQGEDDGDVFLAMELVHGKSLREVIHEEAPLTARESLAILEPILAALRAAHTAGLIHRDVKPENVIVRQDGEVKVADFGLARAVTDQGSTSQTGVLLGTVSYLSPEQVEGRAADQRSDVYAAGLLLFEMLTGRKAVTGDTPIQIAYKHVHTGVPRPSSIVSAVPPDLDSLVARATALEPDDRFASAAEFLATMRAVRRGLTEGELDRRPVTAPMTMHDTSPHDAGHGAGPGVGAAWTVAEPSSGQRAGPVLEATAALPMLPMLPEQDVHSAPSSRRARRARRSRPRRWPWLVAALLLAVTGVGGWWFTAGPGGTTVVPEAIRHSLVDASAALDQASLRVESSESFSESVPKGQVISMQPAAGTEVSKQSLVLLVVSKGPERYDVPKLVGDKASRIKAVLAPLTLKSKTTEDWSETVPEGSVISQKPAPGTAVKRGTVVEVVVSRGRRPIDVPDVRQLPVDQATAKLTEAGLAPVRAEDVNHDTVPAGHVVSQQPEQGTLFRGDEVTIVVSKGPVMVEVPDLLGKPIQEAEATLTGLGFTIEVRRPLGTFFELVRDQSVPGGQPAPKGSTIILTVV
ncbi:Stk1 family PASTA domain-containing Ser/Thr kinase [Intrasporangium sp.]|uniref:Stk1 family PASTA domain-containing Ser/Thr kinase n=1 Tax=Intrasporangium sp. TaxID=1925024 RepID=UPI00293AEE07|nr:Stk1 family PASTA domain-containing Ser/Thr kinase [Intrasporangium sp.]MDV3221576.1 Stk1 family PASTA domain-containing Ser/Thr kinase [Intrasporangium sp.]